MKARYFFAASLFLAVGAAVADSTEIEVGNVLGVMPVTATERPQVLLSVPWVEPGSSANTIAVTNLVKAADLTADDKADYDGDTLTWYNTVEGKYMQWHVECRNGTNQWVEVRMTEGDYMEAVAPYRPVVKQGEVVLLERADSNKVMYVIGQVGANASITNTIPGATIEGGKTYPTFTLLAPPSASGAVFFLNSRGNREEGEDTASLGFDELIIEEGTVDAGDEITVDVVGGLPARYVRKNNKWVLTYGASLDGTPKASVRPGRGFWYKRCGTSDLKVAWGAPHK